jgi:hypothetical protein
MLIFSKTFCENSKIRNRKWSLDGFLNVAMIHETKSVFCPENK